MSTTFTKQTTSNAGLPMSRNPFDHLRAEMEQLISQFSNGWEGEALANLQMPAVDVSETDQAVEIKLDVPGFQSEEINVDLRGNTLFVSGEHKEHKEEKGKRYHRVERRSGSFTRAIPLPVAVKEEKVAAQCREGVLTVTLPKSEEAMNRKIPVKA